LANSERLLYHGGRVLASVNEVISAIDSPDHAVKTLAALGERHITRGTVRRHFEVRIPYGLCTEKGFNGRNI